MIAEAWLKDRRALEIHVRFHSFTRSMSFAVDLVSSIMFRESDGTLDDFPSRRMFQVSNA